VFRTFACHAGKNVGAVEVQKVGDCDRDIVAESVFPTSILAHLLPR